MARYFIRLKFRMLRNRLGRATATGVIGFILVWVGAIGTGIGLGTLMAAGGRLVPRPELIPPIVFVAVSLGWIVGPVVAASFDDALDPRRFETLPIGRTQLGVGLISAGLVGPGAVATFLGLAMGVLGGYGTLVSLPLLVVIVVLEVLLVTTTARFLLTALTDILRSRRSREIIGVLLASLAAIPAILSGMLSTGLVGGMDSLDPVVDVLVWTPPGALGAAVVDAAEGRLVIALTRVAFGVVVVVAVAVGYGWSLGRLQTLSDSGRGPKKVSSAESGRLPHRLLAGPVGAVAYKELIYLRRDNRMRGQLIGAFVGLVALVVVGLSAIRTEFGPFLAVPMAFFVVVTLLVNQFGYDGGTFWGYLLMAPDLEAVLRGKNAAMGLLAVALAWLGGAVGAAIGGVWTHAPTAALSAVALVLIWAAVGNATSLAGPIRMPEKSVFASQSVSGAAFLVSLLGIFAAGFLILPIVIGVALTVVLASPAWGFVSSIVSVGYATAVYVVSFRVTRRFIHTFGPKVLEVIDKG